eukprot:m.7767 g.7767  ORF g.7767 m.7767 type:complete len:61 (+) comp2909_c0_seq1:879-1061(+)
MVLSDLSYDCIVDNGEKETKSGKNTWWTPSTTKTCKVDVMGYTIIYSYNRIVIMYSIKQT